MNATFTCPECDHEHDCPVIRGETSWDDYAEVPEACEACGEPVGDDYGVDDRKSERQQMGITD